MEQERRLERIEDKVDAITSSLNTLHSSMVGMSKDIESNKDSLVEHMRRTELIEAHVAVHNAEIDKSLVPLNKHLTQMHFIVKAIGVLGVVVSIALAIKQLLGK